MRRATVTALALMLLGPPLWADDPPGKAEKPTSVAKQFRAIQDELMKAQQDFFAAYQKASAAEKAKLSYPDSLPAAQRVLKLAEKHPQDPAAVDALVWAIQRGQRDRKLVTAALAQLQRDHLKSPKLQGAMMTLIYSPLPQAEDFLRTVLEKTTSREVQAAAAYALASYLKQNAAMVERLAQLEKQGLFKEGGFYGPELYKRLKATDAKKLAQEIEALYERVQNKYADVKSPYNTRTYGDLAKGELFELRNLAIGKKAPEIVGEDIDGVKFKLSDYLGKVVVLDFWGNW